MIICVTNRLICTGNFFDKIKKACEKADIIILREKDLSEREYFYTAEKVRKICKDYGKEFYVNSFLNTAEKLSADGLQLSFSDFCKNAENGLLYENTGCSVHSVKEAEQACAMGADFIIAGHIFSTDCKKGIKPRGLDFLEKVVKNVDIPVYGIGGINKSNISLIIGAGAAGGCMMSEFMK